MYVPLQLRLTLFYAILLGLALWFFGITVYTQAEQRAYRDLDNTLSSRAASVRLGKDLFIAVDQHPNQLPLTLPSVDRLGIGGVAIEVLDNQLNLLATTTITSNPGDLSQTTVGGPDSSPVPWDALAARAILQQSLNSGSATGSMYSTIT